MAAMRSMYTRAFSRSAAAVLAIGPEDRRFQIPVQVFIGVELRRVRGQVEQFDLLGVLGDPLSDAVGVMHAQVVDDQKDLALRIVNQILQEDDEALGIDGAFDEREAHQALVGDRRDHRR